MQYETENIIADGPNKSSLEGILLISGGGHSIVKAHTPASIGTENFSRT